MHRAVFLEHFQPEVRLRPVEPELQEIADRGQHQGAVLLRPNILQVKAGATEHADVLDTKREMCLTAAAKTSCGFRKGNTRICTLFPLL